MVNSKPGWLVVGRCTGQVTCLTGEGLIVPSSPVPSRRVNRVCRRQHALPTAGKPGEKTFWTSPLGHGRNFGTCELMQWWNTKRMCLFEWSVTLSQCFDKQRSVGWTNVERKQLRFIPDLHATDCGHARVWLILGTHTASSQIEFWRNRADWSKTELWERGLYYEVPIRREPSCAVVLRRRFLAIRVSLSASVHHHLTTVFIQVGATISSPSARNRPPECYSTV
jgi:hypothetical protein